MKSSKNTQCYCCERIATTRDHIPPKCFYPIGYRSNLLTVPSCPLHNNSRTKDDEYTAAVIAMNSNSDISFSMFKSKWIKAMLRREGILGKRIFSKSRTVKLISFKNDLLIPCETLAISYKVERIEHVIESVARAIYYHEFEHQKKWKKSCIVRSPNFLTPDLYRPQDFESLNQTNKAFIYGEKYQELGLVKKGANPNIFYYQFCKLENENYIIRMVFYSNFTFLAFLKDKGNTLLKLTK